MITAALSGNTRHECTSIKVDSTVAEEIEPVLDARLAEC